MDGTRHPVDFFFRDDDVGWNDEWLWPLLELFTDRALPIDLAVIPRELSPPVARTLTETAATAAALVAFHQHGLAHVNHEITGRRYEFGPTRAREQQLRDLAEGRQRLLELLGPEVDPVFTPPWNRCTEETGRCLVELGFRVLSREWHAAPLDISGLYELPVRVDWFAHRKGVRLSLKEFGRLVADAVGRPGPVGMMFHHAAMDRHERAAAGELLSLLASHSQARTHSMTTLVGPTRAQSVAGEQALSRE